MNSAISTDSGLRPWHFFVLGGLLTATAAVFLARETGPTNVVFLSVTIFAATLVGISVYRTLWPLVAPDAGEETEIVGGRTRASLERDKTLVLRSIKELEFDRAMGKVSDADFADMMARLRERAIGLIRQLDSGGYRDVIEQELALRLGQKSVAAAEPAPAVVPDVAVSSAAVAESSVETVQAVRCASCRTLNETDAKFCKNCGSRLV
jgi:hypothetical protein